jgi:hypothetical protein
VPVLRRRCVADPQSIAARARAGRARPRPRHHGTHRGRAAGPQPSPATTPTDVGPSREAVVAGGGAGTRGGAAGRLRADRRRDPAATDRGLVRARFPDPVSAGGRRGGVAWVPCHVRHRGAGLRAGGAQAHVRGERGVPRSGVPLGPRARHHALSARPMDEERPRAHHQRPHVGRHRSAAVSRGSPRAVPGGAPRDATCGAPAAFRPVHPHAHRRHRPDDGAGGRGPRARDRAGPL